MKVNGGKNIYLNNPLVETNCRTNDLLSEQIAVVQELAPKLHSDDLQQLAANLTEIEAALDKLKDFLEYLPKKSK